MTPARRRNFILGFLAALGVIAGLLFLSRMESASRPPAPVRDHPAEFGRIPGLDQPAPADAPTGSAPVAPLIQVPLPRPAPGTFDAGLRSLTNGRPSPSGPVDRRENQGPNAGREMEIIRYAFETLEEDVRECLAQWESTSPGEASEVMIAFEIDKDGLQKSWLEHEKEVPFGPRTCLANAVYGLDWSKIVEQPAKLTQRFELGRKDAN
jgi:hypothetical protein